MIREVVEAMEVLEGTDACGQALLLHRFGYRVEAAERLRARTGKPVVSVRGLFAHALAALL